MAASLQRSGLGQSQIRSAVPALGHGPGQSWGKWGWEHFVGDVVQLGALRQAKLNINFNTQCFLKKQKGWKEEIVHCAALSC